MNLAWLSIPALGHTALIGRILLHSELCMFVQCSKYDFLHEPGTENSSLSEMGKLQNVCSPWQAPTVWPTGEPCNPQEVRGSVLSSPLQGILRGLLERGGGDPRLFELEGMCFVGAGAKMAKLQVCLNGEECAPFVVLWGGGTLLTLLALVCGAC